MSCKLPGCNRPVHPGFDFCGRTHGQQYMSQQSTSPTPASSSSSSSASKTCKLPGCNLPVSPGFDFCGRTHGQQYTSQQGSSSNSNSNSKTCKLPGCNLPVHPGFDFCGKPHGLQYQTITPYNGGKGRICKLPGCNLPVNSGFDFCGITHGQDYKRKHQNQALVEISPSERKFEEIKKQFQVKWEHPTTCPNVRQIFRINMPAQIESSFKAYREGVERQGHFHGKTRRNGKTMDEGNQVRRFHGTALTCDIGQNKTLCNDRNCRICSIIRTSFLISNAGRNFGWLRFGNGIYFSSTSSKSNDYTQTNQAYKAMFLSYVVAGKGFKLTKSQPLLNRNQLNGYDSVIGEPGTDLHYDEIVVYNENAALPAYLILY